MTSTFFKDAHDTICAVLSATPASALCAPLRYFLGIVVALVAVAGCKPASMAATAPDESDLPDDIAQIEATLARNADDLQAAGVVVVARRTDVESGGDAAASPPEVSEPEAEEPPAGEEEGEAPVLAPSDPSPTPESAPPPAMAPKDEDDAPPRRARARRFEARRAGRRGDDRCQRICDLAEATCDLADRICGLATRHPDEVRYETACARAEDQCDSAADACNACAL
jgi:hypothetical protein